MGNAGHGKVHTYFGAFTGEVGAETFDDFGIYALGNANNVLGSPAQLGFVNGDELFGAGLAGGAEIGSGIALVNITANGATEFHELILLNLM